MYGRLSLVLPVAAAAFWLAIVSTANARHVKPAAVAELGASKAVSKGEEKGSSSSSSSSSSLHDHSGGAKAAENGKGGGKNKKDKWKGSNNNSSDSSSLEKGGEQHGGKGSGLKKSKKGTQHSFLSAYAASHSKKGHPDEEHGKSLHPLNSLELMEEHKKYVVQVSAVKKMTRVFGDVTRSLSQTVSDMLTDIDRERLREARERLSMISEDIQLVNAEDVEDRKKVENFLHAADRTKTVYALQALRAARLKHQNELRSLMDEAREVRHEMEFIREDAANQPKSLEGKIRRLQSYDEPLDLGRAMDPQSGALTLSSLSKVGDNLQMAKALQGAVLNDLNYQAKHSTRAAHDQFLDELEPTAGYFSDGDLFDAEISGLLASSGDSHEFIDEVVHDHDRRAKEKVAAIPGGKEPTETSEAISVPPPEHKGEGPGNNMFSRQEHAHHHHHHHQDFFDEPHEEHEPHEGFGEALQGFFPEAFDFALDDEVPAHHFGTGVILPLAHGEADHDQRKDSEASGGGTSFLERRRKERDQRFGSLPRRRQPPSSFLSLADEEHIGTLASSSPIAETPGLGKMRPLSLLQQVGGASRSEKQLPSAHTLAGRHGREGKKSLLRRVLRSSHIQLHDHNEANDSESGGEGESKFEEGNDGESALDGKALGEDAEKENDALATASASEPEEAEEKLQKKDASKEGGKKEGDDATEAVNGGEDKEGTDVTISHVEDDEKAGEDEAKDDEHKDGKAASDGPKTEEAGAKDGSSKGEEGHAATSDRVDDDKKTSDCLELSQEACTKTDRCFYDTVYHICLTDCPRLTREQCDGVTECRFETEVPQNSCINEGYLSKQPTKQSFDGILRGCEEVKSRRLCERLGKAYDDAVKEKKKAEYKCHFLDVQELSDVKDEYGEMEKKAEVDGEVQRSGSARCVDLTKNPSATQLIVATGVAERQKELDREARSSISRTEVGGLCARPSDETIELDPDKPFYSLEEKVEVRCKKGYMLVGAERMMTCQKDGSMQPLITCLAKGVLNEIEKQSLDKSGKLTEGGSGGPPLLLRNATWATVAIGVITSIAMSYG